MAVTPPAREPAGTEVELTSPPSLAAEGGQSGTSPTTRSSPRRTRRTRPRTRTRASRRASLEVHGRARLYERREPRRVPVGQPHAAVRLGVPDVARLRCAVQAI